MTNRFSTDIIKRQGARKRVVLEQDTFTSTFQSALGTESAAEYANIALSDKTLVGGSLNYNEYYSIRSIFNSKGLSETSSIALTLLIIDVAKFSGKSAMSLIEPIIGNDELIMDLAAYTVLNFYRPASSKQNVMIRNNNKKSFKKRNFIA